MGVEGLVNNPVSRVDFYVAVKLKSDDDDDGDDDMGVNNVPPAVDGVGTEALLFIGSANAAGAEDDDWHQHAQIRLGHRYERG